MLTITNGCYRISDKRVFIIPELTINSGHCWAFIGNNGSGKSTLARALSNQQCLLEGTANNRFQSISLLSFEKLQALVEAEWQRNNSDMLGEGEDELGLLTSEIIQQDVKNLQRCQQLAEQFGIVHLLNRRFKHLSTGETRKTLLCQTLMNQPDLLILDEPFEGLDIQSRAQFAKHLHKLAKSGITIALILNRFDDIPSFIENVGVLVECQLVKLGTYEAIIEDLLVQQLTNIERITNIRLPDADEMPIHPSKQQPIIRLTNGYVQYNECAIIDGLTWQVNDGEHWQIVGPNGAGKSTLLSLITGDHPQGYSNDLWLFGRKRGSGETIWDIKRHIGYVSSQLHQDYRVGSSVRAVLLSGYFDSIGIYDAVSDKQNNLIEQWLNILNLAAHADQPFNSLSWGQQRLVLIARALVKHPTLLILDEPLQGLDALNRELVKRWIDLLVKEGNSQLLFVSHHPEDAPNCITHRLSFIHKIGEKYQYRSEKLVD